MYQEEEFWKLFCLRGEFSWGRRKLSANKVTAQGACKLRETEVKRKGSIRLWKVQKWPASLKKVGPLVGSN